MITKTIVVRQQIRVTIDEGHLDEKFMREFRESFYDFRSIEDHMKHLAQCEARGLIGTDNFIEGYGNLDHMSIKFKTISQEEEVIE